MCLGVAASACSKTPEPPPPRPAGLPIAVPRDANLDQVDSLAAFRTQYEQAYRLAPDARFTRALADLEHLLTGKPAPKVEARFQNGQWRFLSDGTEVGSLPEFPDFAQALALLEARARQLGTDKLDLKKAEEASSPTAPPPAPSKKKPAPQKSVKRGTRTTARLASQKKTATPTAEPLSPSAPPLPVGRMTLEALHQQDRDWAAGKRSASSVREGARALASLAFQLMDLTGTADEVPARALAHLALARVVTGEPLDEERMLLASALGYQRAAQQLAESLPADSLTRLYFLRDDARLESLARSEKEPGLAHYLWVRRMADIGSSELSKLEDTRLPEVHELAAMLRAREFGLDRALGIILPPLVLREVAAAAGHTDAEDRAPSKRAPPKAGEQLQQRLKQISERFNLAQRGLLPPFEEELARVGIPEAFFLDEATERAYFQGLFFSANYRLGMHLLDSLSSAEVAARYTKALGSGATPAGKEFQSWMSQLIAAKSGEQVESSLMKSLTELHSFGAAPLLRVFEELQDTMDWGDPALSSMSRRMATRMDTRPAHRLFLARIARSALTDPALSEKLYRASLEVTDSPSLAIWVAWLDRDTAKLESLLDAPGLTGSERLQVLEHLMAAQPMKPEALKEKLTPLLARHPDAWSVTSGCAELLASQGLYGEARSVVEQWQSKHPKPETFDDINARTLIARLYQSEGDAAAGWKAVEPVIGSYKFTALERAALLSQELGEEGRARELAEASYRRYPGPKSLSLVTEVLWRTGRYDEAAEALAKPTRSLRGMDWREHIAARFASVFASRPAKEGLSAFKAIQKKGIGALELTELSRSVKRAGNPELAFELQSRVDAPGLQKLEMIMRAYAYLKQWKSEKDAVEWLRTRVPPQFLEPLSMFAFQDGEDIVLWDVIPLTEGTGENADYVWLMRAAASTRSRDKDAAHQAALHKHFEADRAGFYHQLGRYLLGLIPEQAAIAAATSAKSRQELPFFLGLAARAEGRYEDAVLWYRAAVEASNPRNGEYRWAYEELARLRGAELSMALLKERTL